MGVGHEGDEHNQDNGGYDSIVYADRDGFRIRTRNTEVSEQWMDALDGVGHEFAGLGISGLSAVSIAVEEYAMGDKAKVAAAQQLPIFTEDPTTPGWRINERFGDLFPSFGYTGPGSETTYDLFLNGAVLLQTARAATTLQDLVQPIEFTRNKTHRYTHQVLIPAPQQAVIGDILGTDPVTEISLRYRKREQEEPGVGKILVSPKMLKLGARFVPKSEYTGTFGTVEFIKFNGLDGRSEEMVRMGTGYGDDIFGSEGGSIDGRVAADPVAALGKFTRVVEHIARNRSVFSPGQK